MKRLIAVMVVGLSLSVLACELKAEDLSGRLGIFGMGQWVKALGEKTLKDQSSDGADFGGGLRYGLNKNLGLALSYENMDLRHGARVEPILLSGIYSCTPNKRWTPLTILGLGTAARDPNGRYNNLAARAGIGVEYFLTPFLGLAGLADYTYVTKTGDAPNYAHVVGVGGMLSYYFGRCACHAPAPKPAPAPKAAAPAPVVAITLTPVEVSLGQGQTQPFNANVTGTDNKQVRWAISPALGSVDSGGVYTAPASLAFAEKVTVSATSVADGSKVASGVVNLTPPANAEQKVSIELKVLFDTAKDVVKPEFDAEIAKVADFMKTYPSTQAEIEGHTDSMGAAAYNVDLSQRRADAVRQYLISKLGVDASRLTAKGYGPNRPVADNRTAEGRAKNRRVVATITAVKK